MIRLLRWLAACLLPLALSGCIDLGEEIWLGDDGRCRVEITTGIAEQLLAMNKREDAKAGVRRVLEALREHGRERFGARASIREYARDGKYHFAFVANLDNPEDAAALLNHFHEPKPRHEEAEQIPIRAAHTTTFIRLGSDTLRFEKHLRVAGAAPDRSDPKLRELVASLFRDSRITVRLHAKGVRSINGQVAADGNSVQWIVPMSELVQDPEFDMILAAEMPRRNTMVWWWLAGGAAAALVLVYGFWWRRRLA